MNPLNIHRDIHNSSLISFYLDIIPVSLISLPYPYSFLTLSILLYDSVYIFYCYTFVVCCCYLLVSAVKCGYSYNGCQRAGVIELSLIKALCPLLPLIEGECPPTASSESCFDTFSKYSINAYASHSHFQ